VAHCGVGPRRPRTTLSTPPRCRRCGRSTPRCATSTRRHGRRRDRALLLELLRRLERRDSRARAQAAVPDRRRRRERLLVRPPRRRRRGDRSGARTRRSRHLQHRRRRARPGARVAAGARERARRQAASPLSPLARAAVRGRGPGHDRNRVPRPSNAKAKRELGWDLRYSSWRQGFVAAYAASPTASTGSATPGRTSTRPRSHSNRCLPCTSATARTICSTPRAAPPPQDARRAPARRAKPRSKGPVTAG
jgi:hypothetical protein